jgi:methanogenic corrinoid protein MtbC1
MSEYKTDNIRLNEFENALLAMDKIAIKHLLMNNNDAVSPMQQIEKMIVPVLEKIGNGWEAGKVSLSQVYMSGRLCEEAVDAILPQEAPSRVSTPPMAIAVLEDYHLLGMRIVYSVLRASGFNLQNYGRCDIDEIVTSIKRDDIKIMMVSVLMLPSAIQVSELTHKLKAAGCKTRVIVGGAPFRFDDMLWQEVGADAMGYSAADAVGLIHRFAKENLQ